jgi:chorismate mutase/prephenate dehydratase
MLRLPNQPGSLVNVLIPFQKADIDLTWIESFPANDASPGKSQAYLFFVDVDGHVEDDLLKRTLDAVRKRCERLEVLGSYPKGDCIEN